MASRSSASPPRTELQLEPSGTHVPITERRSQLVVTSGPEQGTVIEIEKTPFVVGKGDECDLVLSAPTVSRQHFAIDTENGAFVVRDLASLNGTWVDQLRVRECWLRPGAQIRAGEQELRFDLVHKALELAPAPAERFGALVGRSVRMRQVFALLERIAKTEATVILLGETGTGKSAVARAIHDASPRRKGPFVTFDCGAISENLIESELFGHEKGAFTGADRLRQGALEQAQGGTLFIDELVDLRLDLQPRLLRVLEEREMRRVGGNTSMKLDVRIIAASRFDLWREVQENRFREDLYFRLAVFTIPLPPLRERKEDIAFLAMDFARAQSRVGNGGQRLLARLSPEVLNRLCEHPFPGNVRELRNVIERSALLDIDPGEMSALFSNTGTTAKAASGPQAASTSSGGSASNASTVPTAEFASQPSPEPSLDSASSELVADWGLPFKEAKEKLLEAFETAYFRRLLGVEQGNASAVARRAGIDRKHLYTLAKKHGFDLKSPAGATNQSTYTEKS